jgi:hypothetical protein
MVLALVFLAVAIGQRVFGEQLHLNRNILMTFTVLLMMASIQFILMGLLAEIMVRTYHESQGRPTYVVRDRLGGPDAGAGK